ncbi:PREDICTED: piggyBac transposable element-derived protein 4-like [Priapulus caudatus]|uniref:PiggyBac transposable element-derived protein 4-like n=1 Tax=Priapulus caudatus TaxID=37621 RepID=A0ABM1DTL8_PRICU|nr:PREDICTED: piggyBac transposable element-derived protein 4-like [Priapulus caudatus]
MKAFIGLVLAMAIHKLPQINNYWSSNWVLNVPQFCQVFTTKRFWALWSNIHLVNNETALPRDHADHDRLFKVRPILNILTRTFEDNYSPGQCVAVDESMVRFKGRSSLKQYMPMKPIKRGFKVWSASCSCCGYLYGFQVYTGKVPGSESKGMAHRVVADLTLPLLAGKNHIVYVDNFFTSLPLITELHQNSVYLCGTYRASRVGFPRELQDSNAIKRLERGNSIMMVKGEIAACVWKDKKPVYVVSNAHCPRIITNVKRRTHDGSRIQVSSPQMVSEYNNYMGGVDLLDQMKGCYGYSRKSKRWWLRLLYHFVDAWHDKLIHASNLHSYQYYWHPPMLVVVPKTADHRCELI